MRGSAAARGFVFLVGTFLGVLAGVPASQGFEAFDGRLQVHGFFESQLRAISGNYQEDWDLTQWYNVLNVELEFDIIEDTTGPFDVLSAYARIEARYDCVWKRACGIARSADAYGDRSERIPYRLADAEQYDATGVADTCRADTTDANTGRKQRQWPWVDI